MLRNTCLSIKRVLAILAVAVVTAFAGVASAESPACPIKIRIAKPQWGQIKGADDFAMYGDLNISVVIENVSAEDVRLWREDNSWGCQNIDFEIIDAHQRRHSIKMHAPLWAKNYRNFVVLAPGEVIVRTAKVSDTNFWKGCPIPKLGAMGEPFEMRANYSIHETPEKDAAQFGIWTGAAQSPWHTYFISHDR